MSQGVEALRLDVSAVGAGVWALWGRDVQGEGGVRSRVPVCVMLFWLSRCSGLTARPPAMPSGGPGCPLRFQLAAWAELFLGTRPVPWGSRCRHLAIQHKLQSFIMMKKEVPQVPCVVPLRRSVGSLAHAMFR